MENEVVKNEDMVSAEQVESKAVNGGKLLIGRTPSVWKGKTIHEYYVEMTLKGKEMRARFKPAGSDDVHGYDVMDLVFVGAKEVEFRREVTKQADYATGEVKDKDVYTMCSKDEEGMEYYASIKPYKKSDEDVLKMIIRRFEIMNKAE